MAIPKLNEKHTALTVGIFAAIVYAVWAAIVAAGSGQATLDWIKGLHFVNKVVTVTPFDAITAVTGIIVTFVIYAVAGWLFAATWNWVAKQKWAK